ncbi:hypothetical protein LJB87_01915 [Alistipes sp. OttesenSCG-928-L06]|nr:hypothetical protein [Alistipes sp. OttesenSCG-928-L06]
MEKQYKRQHRELDDATKAKISATLKGRGKTPTHAKNISTGMTQYWQDVPSREAGDNGNNMSNPDKPDGIM